MQEPKLIKRSSLMDKSVKEQRKILIIATFFLVTLFFGSSYALLTNFDRTTNNVVNISTGNMSATVTTNQDITLTGKVPETDVSGIANANAVKVTITNNGTLNIKKYTVKLLKEDGKTSTLDYPYIRFAISLDGTNYISPRNLGKSNNIVYTGYDLGTANNNKTKEFYIKVWIDGDAASNGLNKTFYGALSVDLYQKDTPEESTTSSVILSKVIGKQNTTCQTYYYDSSDNDNITYISGSATCIDFNYVWYSGKMWRITAIYPDGSMKLVTENDITAIFWGSSIEYDGSYMYQWLNEDFLDTLYPKVTYNEQTHEYSHPVLKTNAVWNYSTDGNSPPVRPETIATQKTKTATVGLLNAYEYYNSYRCNGSSACTGSTFGSGYLNNSLYWWLITPYSDSRVRNVGNIGYLYDDSPSDYARGVRPSIILQSNIPLSGSGTKTEPYRLVGIDASANVGDNLYSRYSGEYVNFNGEKYRIVSIENNITKLTKVDYIKDGTTVVSKNFASSVYFKKDGNTQTDTFWDYYLNNNSEGGWLYSIPSTYKNMMVDGTYYLGQYGSSNVNYKATVCSDSASTLNSTTITINNCTKYTSQDTDKTFTGKVGLPRVGEMFSAQLKVGINSYSNMWLITPSSSSRVRIVDSYGYLSDRSPSSSAYAARPSINLSSAVKIACNSSKCDGTEEHPYDLSCTQCQS